MFPNIPRELTPAYLTDGKVDAGYLRPFFSEKTGQPMVTVKNGYKRVVKNGKTILEPQYRTIPAPNMFHNNMLRKYDWEQIDAALLRVTHAPNMAFNDFQRLGLTFPLDGIGVQVSTYEQASGMTEADVTMEGIVPGARDRVKFTPQNLPVPFIIKDFQITMRQLEAGRRGNGALETTHIEEATQSVVNKIDDMIINGDPLQIGDGNQIWGFTNKPERLQRAANAADIGGGDFSTGGNAYKTIAGATNLLRSLGFYGPYGVYIAIAQYAEIMQLVSGTSESELSAIQKNLPNIAFVNPSHRLTAGQAVVFQATTSVADMAIAQNIAPIQWAINPFMVDFRVFGVMTIRIKHDAAGNCGVVHLTGC